MIFFFNDTATTEIYTLSLHDALPICYGGRMANAKRHQATLLAREFSCEQRSEEHTSELQSRENLVCRLLLEKKNSMSVCPLNIDPDRPRGQDEQQYAKRGLERVRHTR